MPILEVKNIKKGFGDTDVLKGVSFSMERGQVLAIIGSSGSGKTTLLRCLNFLETPDEGEIWVNGKLLTGENLSDDQIRQNRLHFGLVFQNFNLFPQYTALENIMLAPSLLKKGTPAQIRETAMSLLGRVGLSHKADSYPYQLSGGQQQRVAIARALALQPEVLCFDEPTSALDPELTGEVLKVIRSLKGRDNTMVVVTHEMEFARSVADVVIYMADGVIEEFGTPEEVFGNPRSEKPEISCKAPRTPVTVWHRCTGSLKFLPTIYKKTRPASTAERVFCRMVKNRIADYRTFSPMVSSQILIVSFNNVIANSLHNLFDNRLYKKSTVIPSKLRWICVVWWSRGESNPCPKATWKELLRAQFVICIPFPRREQTPYEDR